MMKSGGESGERCRPSALARAIIAHASSSRACQPFRDRERGARVSGQQMKIMGKGASRLPGAALVIDEHTDPLRREQPLESEEAKSRTVFRSMHQHDDGHRCWPCGQYEATGKLHIAANESLFLRVEIHPMAGHAVKIDVALGAARKVDDFAVGVAGPTRGAGPFAVGAPR